MLTASYLLGKKVRNRYKDMPYESGIVPTGDARHRFSVKFYLVAMVFILFDIETVFLYPWAVVFRELRMFAHSLRFVLPSSTAPAARSCPATKASTSPGGTTTPAP